MPASRFQAEQGDIVRLRVRFERNGALFDPFSIDFVEVRRDTGPTTSDLVATIPGTSVIQEAQGIFYVDYAIPAAELVGAYIDRWFYVTDAGDPQTSDDARFAVLPVGSVSLGTGGYITIDEIKGTYLPGTLLTDTDLAILIDQATELVNVYTGQTFGEDARTYELDGTGQPWIILPEYIQSILSIEVACLDQVAELAPLDFAIKGRWLVGKSFLPWPIDQCSVEQILCGCSGGATLFPRGQKNVTISGTFGLYENVPALIRRATGLLVMHGGRDDNRTSPMAYNFATESVEQHSYSLRELAGSMVQLKGSTGIVEVDHILNMFRKIRGRVAVI